MVRVLGPRTAVDSDGTPLLLPGWDGDDVSWPRTLIPLLSAHPFAAIDHRTRSAARSRSFQ